MNRILPAVLLLVSMMNLPLAQAQQGPRYAAIDHVELFAVDLERSLDFYTRLFGAEVWKLRQGERRYLPLGSAYLAVEQRDSAAVDHVCFGIDGFDIDSMHAWLTRQELPWQDYPSGRDLHVDDRNGIRIQLANNGTWQQLAGSTALPEKPAPTEAAIFQALALDEVFLTVRNLEVDGLFYARLMDQTGVLQAGSLWFRVGEHARLRLTQTPPGQSPGLNYFSVLVANTDFEAAADAVFAAGGIIETILPNGFSFWDPDGHRVLVRGAPQVLGAPGQPR